MKIGMMSRWNATCGVSVHAELIGRAWVEMGDEVTIFAPVERNSTSITNKDELYVIRCYRLDTPSYFDPKPFLENDYDIFVAQNLEILPMKPLLEIYPEIKKKALALMIVHEGRLPKDPNFYKFDWDWIICFDERYKRFLTKAFPEEKIKIISYPCHPVMLGDKKESRKNLGLPLDKKIILNYGIGVYRHLHLLPEIERLSKEYPLMFLVITDHPDWFDLWDAVRERYKFIKLINRSLTVEELYSYLHASDALLIHKDSAENVAVSSTVYLCLGSGCPILAHSVNFVETLKEEIMKYGSLTKKLVEVFEEKEAYRRTVKKALQYARDNSAYIVANKIKEVVS
ncbi:MAG TPA: hypothetical protein C5S37_13410 [Methanophagales archaeon]|nr:hypothetical protein [Methanophagales archaeon]